MKQQTMALARVAVIFTLVFTVLPVLAAPQQAPQEIQEPPTWWYDPDKPTPRQSTQVFQQPEWWYTHQDEQALGRDFTTIDINVDLAASQSLRDGAINLDIAVIADGSTPEVIVQVLSEDVPDSAVYAGYERTPDGAVQNLGGFQQARFLGGVGTDNAARIRLKYDPQSAGWVAFTVQVLVGGYMLYGPREHAIYVSQVTPDFTSVQASASLPGAQDLNAGAFPLDVQVTADGPTPAIVVQVISENVPDQAVYAGYEKTPDGAIQNQGGYQQAWFLGGVGPDNTARIRFNYEPQSPGWTVFTVQVLVGGNMIYGPREHSIYINQVIPNFTSLSASVSLAGSQGMNAGPIPLQINVSSDGHTPPVVIQAISEHVPERAVYAGHESTPAGAVQNLGSIQQVQFMGGVGPDHTAQVRFEYESLVEGWIVFTVQVSIGDYMWYGPQEHAIYIRQTGTASTTYPPRIKNFSPGAQLSEQVRFSADISGDPPPEYNLDCGSADAEMTLKLLACHYQETGYYTATLTATNNVEGTQYFTTATAGVLVPSHILYLPLTALGR
jgi:hypothetical protein